MKNVKNNIAYLVFALAMASLPLLWPQTISKAQVIITRAENLTQQKIDSINGEKNKSIDSALKIAKTLPQMSVTLSKAIRQNKTVTKPQFLKPEVLIRFGGEIYEADPEEYKGYLIIDYDKFIAQMEPDSIINEFVDPPKTEIIKPPKRNWFQRIFH